MYFSQGAFSEAEAMYTKSIDTESSYAPAWLNRANSRVQLKNFGGAIEDYNMYLMLDPATWQKDSIRQLVALLQGEKNGGR